MLAHQPGEIEEVLLRRRPLGELHSPPLRDELLGGHDSGLSHGVGNGHARAQCAGTRPSSITVGAAASKTANLPHGFVVGCET